MPISLKLAAGFLNAGRPFETSRRSKWLSSFSFDSSIPSFEHAIGIQRTWRDGKGKGREGEMEQLRVLQCHPRLAPIFLLSTLGLCFLFLLYRAPPWDMNNCSSVDGVDPWMLEAKVTTDRESSSGRTEKPAHEKSTAQFLQEKVQSGCLLENYQEVLESDELTGLDFSTRALLLELVSSISSGSAVAAPGQVEEWGLLNFDYGVARVVRRLVVCSAYRTSLREFTVITLSPDFTMPTANPDFINLPPKDPAVKRSCTWLADGSAGAPRFGSLGEMNETGRASVSNGVAEFRWIGEIHGSSYDVLLIHCSFPQAVGTDLSGGFLYLNMTHGSGDSAPTELAPVYRERSMMLNASLYEFPRQFQYEFAYCSAPVFTILTPNHVKQFLMYHYALLEPLGAVHFFIYDSQGIDINTMAVLQPLIDAGSLTIINFRKESDYDTWYHSQDLAINDCLYRVKDLANWVLSWDMDEYLHVRPPLTLSAVLEVQKDTPWISFGKIDFDLNHCAPNKSVTEEWAVERMVWRQPNPICGVDCNGDSGARKWMANPRKIKAGKIHAVADLSVMGGVVLSTDVARMNHYRGLVSPRGRVNCGQVRDPILSNSTQSSTHRRMVLWSDFELASVVSSTFKSSVETLSMFQDLRTS